VFISCMPGVARLVFFLLLLWLLWSERAALKGRWFPLLVAFYVTMVFVVFSLEMRGGGRYGYVPSMMELVFLLSVSVSALKRKKFVYALAFVFCLFVVTSYFRTRDIYDPAWERYSMANVKVSAEGDRYIRLFPQWEGRDIRMIIERATR
jgi:hypothetical protein